jgi:hypothetical protein
MAHAEKIDFGPTSDKQRPLKSKAKCAIDATPADIASAYAPEDIAQIADGCIDPFG